MPDMRLTTAQTNLTNNVTNRSALDSVATEMANSQFLDLMMTRLNAMPQSNDEEIKVLAQKVAQNKGADKADNIALLKRLQKLSENDAPSAVTNSSAADKVAAKAEVKERIKARINEIAQSNNAQVTDKSALETLQKVAKFLLKAEEEGKIDLPEEVTAQLQAFLAKGDDLKAYDIANFMHGFIDTLRHSVVNLNVETTDAEPLKWPEDIMESFKDLGLNGIISSGDKPVDMMQAMRIVKALVTQSEKAATDTLDAKSKEAIATQDEKQILAASATAGASVVKTEEAKAVPAAAEASVTGAAASVALPHEALKAQEKAAASAPAASATTPINVSSFDTAPKTDKKAAPTLTQIAMEAATAQKKQNNANSDTNNNDTRGKTAEQNGRGNAPAAGQAVNNALAADIKFSAVAPAETNLGGAHSSTVTNVGNVNGVAGPSAATIARAATIAANTGAENAKPSAATQQVMVQIQQKLNKDTSISVQLSPAELGRVEVRMNIGRDGQVQTIVSADRPETLALLQKDASHLEKALQNAGLNANSSNMSFNLREERNAQQFGQGRKRFSREAIDENAIKDISLNVMNDGQIISDNRINYHA